MSASNQPEPRRSETVADLARTDPEQQTTTQARRFRFSLEETEPDDQPVSPARCAPGPTRFLTEEPISSTKNSQKRAASRAGTSENTRVDSLKEPINKPRATSAVPEENSSVNKWHHVDQRKTGSVAENTSTTRVEHNKSSESEVEKNRSPLTDSAESKSLPDKHFWHRKIWLTGLILLVVLAGIGAFFLPRLFHLADSSGPTMQNSSKRPSLTRLELPETVSDFELVPDLPAPEITEYESGLKTTSGIYREKTAGENRVIVFLSQPVANSEEIVTRLSMENLSTESNSVCGTSPEYGFDGCVQLVEDVAILVMGTEGQSRASLVKTLEVFISNLS